MCAAPRSEGSRWRAPRCGAARARWHSTGAPRALEDRRAQGQQHAASCRQDAAGTQPGLKILIRVAGQPRDFQVFDELRAARIKEDARLGEVIGRGQQVTVVDVRGNRVLVRSAGDGAQPAV